MKFKIVKSKLIEKLITPQNVLQFLPLFKNSLKNTDYFYKKLSFDFSSTKTRIIWSVNFKKSILGLKFRNIKKEKIIDNWLLLFYFPSSKSKLGYFFENIERIIQTRITLSIFYFLHSLFPNFKNQKLKIGIIGLGSIGSYLTKVLAFQNQSLKIMAKSKKDFSSLEDRLKNFIKQLPPSFQNNLTPCPKIDLMKDVDILINASKGENNYYNFLSDFKNLKALVDIAKNWPVGKWLNLFDIFIFDDKKLVNNFSPAFLYTLKNFKKIYNLYEFNKKKSFFVGKNKKIIFTILGFPIFEFELAKLIIERGGRLKNLPSLLKP